jgi:hypothetical protein
MGFGLYGLGNFAGGLAGGLYQGQKMSHDMDRQKREREEQERMQGMRRAAGNTLGNVGTEREDGSLYTEENAYGDYAKQVAPYDAQASMGARTAGLQMKQLNRNERQNNLAETYLQLQRRLATGDHPMNVFLDASRAYGQVNDGKQISLSEDAAGIPMIALTDVAQGRTRMVQFSPENVQAVVRNLYALSSPQAYQQEREMGLKEQTVGVAQQNADSTRITANATAGYRDDQRRLIDGQLGLLGAQQKYWGGRQTDPQMRIPEADRIVLTGLERQEQLLTKAVAEAETPQLGAQANAELRRVRSAKFDQMKRLKVLPDGVTKTQFLGLPDPLQMARQAMSTAQGEQDFRASMDQFQSIYGDAPEAAQAWNAMQVFMNNQYYSRVKPQTPQRGLLKQIASPWSDMTEEQGLRMREQFPYGIGKAN